MSNYTIYTELIIVIKLFRYYKYIRTRTPKIEYIGKRYIEFTEKTTRAPNIPNKSLKTKIAFDQQEDSTHNRIDRQGNEEVYPKRYVYNGSKNHKIAPKM